MRIGVPHASNLTNSLPEQITDPAFPRQLKRIIRNLYDQLDYARGTSSGQSEYLISPTNGTLQVPYGGTGTTSGVSGGIPYYSATTLMASTALLKQNNLMLGGGSGTAPGTMAHPSTANQYALTGTTGTSAPVWTIATSSAATSTLALRDATGGLAMATLTATAGIFSAGVTISGVLLAGAATFSGAMQAQAITMATLTAGSATFSGTIHAQGATFSAVRSTTLTVIGASTLSAVSCATLTATAATFSGTIHGQAATLTAVNVSSLTVSGAATMAAVSMATLTGTSATLTGTLRVGGGLTVAAAATLAAVGMATLTGTAATFTGTVQGVGATFSAAVNAANLSATGASTLSAVAMATLTGTAATFTGAINAQGATFTSIQVTTLTATNVSLSSASLTTPLALTSGGSGATSSAAAATAFGLGTGNSPAFTGLTLTGAFSGTTITASSATFSGTVIAERLIVNGATTLSATGMATLTATAATFTGVMTAAAATFTGAMQLGSTLTVLGVSNFAAVTFTGAINAQWASFTTVSAATFTGALVGNVTGNITGTAPAGSLTGTALPAAVVTSSLTSVGTITSGVWNAGAITSSGTVSSPTLRITGDGPSLGAGINLQQAHASGTGGFIGYSMWRSDDANGGWLVGTSGAVVGDFAIYQNQGAGTPVSRMNIGTTGNISFNGGTITSGVWNAGAITSSGTVAGDRVRAGADLTNQSGDISANRGNGTGVVYLGATTRYLYFDGGQYQFSGAGLAIGAMPGGSTLTSGDLLVNRGGASPGTGAVYFGSSALAHYIYYDGSVFNFTDGITSSGAAKFSGWVTTSTGSPLAWNSAAASIYLSSTYAGAVNLEVADGRIGFYTAPSGTAGNLITFTERLSIANTGAISTTGSFTAGAIKGTSWEQTTAANAVSPTAPDRTITVVCNGVTLYIAAKTTND